MDIEIENYKKQQLTIDLVGANIFALVIMIPIGMFYGLPYYLCWHQQFQSANLPGLFSAIVPDYIGGATVVVWTLLIGGIVLHELIHGIIWAIFAENGMKSIKFGVKWKMLTPYCHCNEPLTVRQYIWGAITPAIILGVIPAIISILFGYFWLLIFALFFTSAASGDFLIILQLKDEKRDDLVLDHPSEAGCFIFRKDKDLAE